MAKKDFIVTPYDVEGEVDYTRLTKKFGTKLIDDSLLKRIKKHTKDLHFMLRRRVFFSHRDLNWLLNKYENGEKFYLYTGRGPSGSMHLGHLLPFMFTKWLQDKFKAKLLIQVTNDEKFLAKNLSLEETTKQSIEDVKDIIALGFDPKLTEIIIDTNYSKTLYNAALPIAKKITFSTVKSSFGFKESTNIGQIFYTSFQAVPAILESIRQGKNVPCLIPLAVDQDPHFRVARDVYPKLGYYNPAIIHSRFLPALQGASGKMSSSKEASAIFTIDNEDTVKKKVMKYAFSGGKDTVAEHRKKGGNTETDISYQYLYQLLEPDDKKLLKIKEEYESGKLLSGELKMIMIAAANKLLKKHQSERKKAEKKFDKFIIKD